MPPVIQVNDLQVTPNDCPLGEAMEVAIQQGIATNANTLFRFHAENPLTVDMSFTSDQPLQQVFWEVCHEWHSNIVAPYSPTSEARMLYSHTRRAHFV